MQKRDVFAFGAEARFLVDEPDSGGTASFQRTDEVLDDEAHVVNAGSTFGDELADG